MLLVQEAHFENHCPREKDSCEALRVNVTAPGKGDLSGIYYMYELGIFLLKAFNWARGLDHMLRLGRLPFQTILSRFMVLCYLPVIVRHLQPKYC